MINNTTFIMFLVLFGIVIVLSLLINYNESIREIETKELEDQILNSRQMIDLLKKKTTTTENLLFELLAKQTLHTFDCETKCLLSFVGDVAVNENSKKTINLINDKNPDGIFFAGDLSYSNPQSWFELTKQLNKSETFLALGNHEIGYPSEEWLSPYNITNTFYSVKTELVNIIVIDTELQGLELQSQYNFVKTELKNSKSDFIIILGHRPIFATVRPADNYTDMFIPLFTKYDVDLVVQGHNHLYERSNTIKMSDDGSIRVADKGQIYVTVGTGGKSLREDYREHNVIAHRESSDYGVLFIDINADRIKGEFITHNNIVNDSFEIRQKDN